jgi:hypothetical protein
MIAESKRIEFWNFLASEKNQARPKGITVHRLAAVKTALIAKDDLWTAVIELHGAGRRAAAEFYQSKEPASNSSRTAFWDEVRLYIRRNENKDTERNPSFKVKGKPARKSFNNKRGK